MSLALLKNTAWGVLGEFAVRGAKIAQVILIARLLGAENLGLFSYAIALAGLFSVLFDFGIMPVAVKTLAAHPGSGALRLFGGLKMLTSSVGILLLGGAAMLSKVSPTDAWIAFGMGVFLALNDLATFVTVVYRARGEFWRETALRSTMAVLQLVACVVTLLLTRSVGMMVVALIVTALLGAIPLAREWRRHPPITGTDLGWHGLRTALRQCLPLAGAVLTGSVYMNLDIVVLGNHASMEEVGWYGVAVKAIFSLMIMPLHYLQLATLPAFASGSSDTINARWLRTYVLSTTVGAVISLVTAMLAGQLLSVLFGASFAGAAPVLVAFSLIGFMFYLYTPLSQWLLLQGRQKQTLWFHATAMGVNLIAVPLLVPQWGLWGAVTAAFCTHLTIAFAHAAVVLRLKNFPDNRSDLLALLKLAIVTPAAIIALGLQVGGPLVSRLAAIGLFLLISHRELISLSRYLSLASHRLFSWNTP